MALDLKPYLNLPRLCMARYTVGQPHRRQPSRRIHLFRRNRRHDRDEIVLISGIVEWPFFHFLQFGVNRIGDAIWQLRAPSRYRYSYPCMVTSDHFDNTRNGGRRITIHCRENPLKAWNEGQLGIFAIEKSTRLRERTGVLLSMLLLVKENLLFDRPRIPFLDDPVSGGQFG